MPSAPAPLVAAYEAVPPALRAVALMVAAAFCLTGMNVSVKFIAGDIHPFAIAFFRHVIGVTLMAPLFLRRAGNPLRTSRLGLHGVRAALNVIAMLAYFLALTLEPLATVVSLSFTAPLIATVLAMAVLGERVSILRGGALLIGLAGALIILRPWSVSISEGALLLLLSSTTWATALIVIKVLSRTETPVTITLYASLLQIPFTLVAALFYWSWPTPGQFAVLVLIAICGSGAQLLLSQAFREADATVVLPADFTKLVFAGIAGWVLFAETPEIWIWIGGTVVFSGVLLNAVLDRRDRQRAARLAPAAENRQSSGNQGA